MLFEKYRPKTFDEMLGQREIIERVKINVEYIKQNLTLPLEDRRMMHWLFTGPAGTGKTAVAHCIAQALFGGTIKDNFNGHFIHFDASDARKIEDVRGPFKRIATASGIYLLFLHEADNITGDAQQAMRTMMETTKTTMFILNGNRYWKIIDPIRSRCVIYRFRKLDDQSVYRYIAKVIKMEGITVTLDDKETLNLLIRQANGDLRQATIILESLITPDKHLCSKNLYVNTKPIIMNDAIQAALDGDSERALHILTDAVVNARHDTDQLIDELYESLSKLDKGKYNLEVINRLYDRLSEAERGCLQGGNPLIQLSGFMMFAWIAPHLRKVISN